MARSTPPSIASTIEAESCGKQIEARSRGEVASDLIERLVVLDIVLQGVNKRRDVGDQVGRVSGTAGFRWAVRLSLSGKKPKRKPALRPDSAEI